MSKKSQHEQEASNESSMCVKVVCWCDTQDKEKSRESLGGLIPADCVGREIWMFKMIENLSYSLKVNEFTEFDNQREMCWIECGHLGIFLVDVESKSFPDVVKVVQKLESSRA